MNGSGTALQSEVQNCLFLADGDNLTNRGFRRQAQARVDLFAQACCEAGAYTRTIVRNYFTAREMRAWGDHGFERISVQDNCDAEVIRRGLNAIESGVRKLIIASGDAGIVLPVASAAIAAGVQVEVWSRASACSKQFFGLRVRFIDRFLLEPPPRRIPAPGFRAPQLGL